MERLTSTVAAEWFQSVSGLWDRRNAHRLGLHHHQQGFNPSPVCGTGEIERAGKPRGGIRRFNPSPVCGTGEIWSGWRD